MIVTNGALQTLTLGGGHALECARLVPAQIVWAHRPRRRKMAAMKRSSASLGHRRCKLALSEQPRTASVQSRAQFVPPHADMGVFCRRALHEEDQ